MASAGAFDMNEVDIEDEIEKVRIFLRVKRRGRK